VSFAEREGSSDFHQPLVQFFDVSTTLSPGIEATKARLDAIKLEIEIAVITTRDEITDTVDVQEEKRLLRVDHALWGTSKHHLHAEFHPLVQIRRVSVKSVRCVR